MADQTTRSAGALRGGIVVTSVACALVPVALLLVWTMWEAKRSGADGSDAEVNPVLAEAIIVADSLDRWMSDNEVILRTWGEVPAIVEGVRKAAVEHHERGYIDRTPEEVNAALVHKRHLGMAPQADEFIVAQVERSEAWAQVHYTDEYGFTVGGTGGEEDFVQTDERWWNAAWSNGRHEERVVHDAALGGYGLRVALRMHDPATGAAIGVIDATLAIDALQELSDELAADSGNDIRILSDWGELLAETGSGHARDRIVRMSSETLAREPWHGGIGNAGSSGGAIEANVQRGWVRLNEAEGPHRDWIVVLERKTEGAAGVVRHILTAGTALLVAAVLGIVGGLLTRSRIVERLRRLADQAEHLSRADTTAKIEDEADDEIGHLARSLEQLRRRIERAVQARHSQRHA